MATQQVLRRRKGPEQTAGAAAPITAQPLAGGPDSASTGGRGTVHPPYVRMGMGREAAKVALMGKADGVFVVHASDDAWAELTMAFGGTLRTYYLELPEDSGKLRLRGNFKPEIGNLAELVAFYARQDNGRKDIPCPLDTATAATILSRV